MNMLAAPAPARASGARPRPAPNGGPDIPALLARLLRHSPLIAGALLIGAMLGYALLRCVPVRYTSSVSILIDPKKPDSYGAEGAFTNLYVDNAKISSVELIMDSSELLDRVVKAERLADLAEYGDARQSLMQRYLPFLGGSRITQPNTPQARDLRALDRLAHAVRTERIGMTYVIEVDVSASTPVLAQRLASAVANAYLNDQLETKYDAAERDTAWLQDRLKQLRGTLIRSEDVVETIRKRYGLTQTDSAPGSTVDRQTITEITAELAQADGEVAAKQARYDQVKRVEQSGGNLQGLPEVGASQVIVALRQQQANSNRVVADLSARYTSAYPGLKAAEADQRTVNAQIGAEVSRIVDGIRDDAQAAASHREALRAQLAELVNSNGDAAGASGRIELREAEQVAAANRTIYDASLNRLRDVEQQQTRVQPEARIISPAQASGSPSFPKPIIFLGGGGFAGVLAGLGLTFLLPMFERRVVSVAGAEQSFALPVLARIPYLRRKDLSTDERLLTIVEYLSIRPLSRFADSLRSLRIGLRLMEKTGTVVQITSAVPREGKSMLAATLAVSAAATGLKTVLVDLDFYRPTISKVFGLAEQEGVVDILLGTAVTRAVLQSHQTLPLRVIGAGSSLRPRPDTVEKPQFRRFVEELSKSFDLVILDTAPVLAASDALLISSVADATVVVVAWRSTQQEQVDQAVASLRAAGAPLAGIALNKVQAKTFITYDGYGAGYPESATA